MRAHGPTGRVAGAATEMLSGSQPSSSTACPTYVLPRAPVPVRPTLTPRPDTTAGALAAQFHPRRLWVAAMSRHSDRQADLPRRKKRSQRRVDIVWGENRAPPGLGFGGGAPPRAGGAARR